MFIKLIGLYHMDPTNNNYTGYWQKLGQYAFQFTSDKSHASKLTQEEVDAILKYKTHYCKMYGAYDMVVEPAD